MTTESVKKDDLKHANTRACVLRRIARVDMFTSLRTVQGSTCKQPRSRPFTSLHAKGKASPSLILL